MLKVRWLRLLSPDLIFSFSMIGVDPCDFNSVGLRNIVGIYSLLELSNMVLNKTLEPYWLMLSE